METLFIHVTNKGQPKIKFISTGFIALANYLKSKGHDIKIINTFIEEELNKDFNLTEYIKKNNYKILCFSLQWHYQSKAVINAIKEIKQALPNSKVILGGKTASFFSDEIMENFKEIDYIIRGYAELPLLNLIDSIKNNKPLENIPNLIWRKDNNIIKNKEIYLPTKEILGELEFSNTELVNNNQTYDKTGLAYEDKENKWLLVYNCGIGCPYDCSFCAGSKSCQKYVNSELSQPIFIEHEEVLKRLKTMAEKGLGVWYTSFDPLPGADYYPNLFKKISQNNLNIRCKFECCGLPTKGFIKQFKETFKDGSELVLSPETGSESVRKKNKGYFYTNKQLISTLNEIEEHNLSCVLYFTIGLPNETKEDIVKTLSLVNFLRKRFQNIKITAVPIELEPGSPMFVNSEDLNIKKNRNTFIDYYKLEEKPDLGYSTNHLSEQEIIEAAKLINIEANCKTTRSVFLKAMTDTLFDPDYFNIKDIWNYCSVCRHFKECFKYPLNKKL